MAKVNFYIDKKEGVKEASVFLYFRFAGQTLKMATGIKVATAQWDANKQRLKKSAGGLWSEINTYLAGLEVAINNLYTQIITSGEKPNAAQLKALLMQKMQKQMPTEPVTLIEFCKAFIVQAQQRGLSKSTVKIYQTTLAHLTNFARITKTSVEFANITHQFYHAYTNYLTNTLMLQPNTVGLHIKKLKAILNAAAEQLPTGTVPSDFKSRYFKAPANDSYSIYLTEQELTALYEMTPPNARLETVRDVFLIGCYTGLRFSDLSAISENNVQDNLLVINTQKTQHKVYIPIHYRVRALLVKYQYRLPRSISIQKMNAYLKELGELAGICTPVEVIVERAGVRVKVVQPKYELMSTHTARRSFATNAYLAGVPSLTIMRMTGHTKEATFLKYIKITQQQHAEFAASHPFFTDPTEKTNPR